MAAHAGQLVGQNGAPGLADLGHVPWIGTAGSAKVLKALRTLRSAAKS